MSNLIVSTRPVGGRRRDTADGRRFDEAGSRHGRNDLKSSSRVCEHDRQASATRESSSRTGRIRQRSTVGPLKDGPGSIKRWRRWQRVVQRVGGAGGAVEIDETVVGRARRPGDAQRDTPGGRRGGQIYSNLRLSVRYPSQTVTALARWEGSQQLGTLPRVRVELIKRGDPRVRAGGASALLFTQS